LLPSVLGPLSAYLRQQYGRCTGISFIDSTTLSVWDNHRIHCHQVFSGLAKRAIVETVIDQLKNISQIEHTRHRSPINFVVNVIAGLIAYCHQPKKPSLNINRFQSALIAYP
jgi:hypothetical protein